MLCACERVSAGETHNKCISKLAASCKKKKNSKCKVHISLEKCKTIHHLDTLFSPSHSEQAGSAQTAHVFYSSAGLVACQGREAWNTHELPVRLNPEQRYLRTPEPESVYYWNGVFTSLKETTATIIMVIVNITMKIIILYKYAYYDAVMNNISSGSRGIGGISFMG